VHNPPDFLIVAAFCPRIWGAPVVFAIHDIAPSFSPPADALLATRHAE
jgi:hypothetical protein